MSENFQKRANQMKTPSIKAKRYLYQKNSKQNWYLKSKERTMLTICVNYLKQVKSTTIGQLQNLEEIKDIKCMANNNTRQFAIKFIVMFMAKMGWVSTYCNNNAKVIKWNKKL